MTEQRDRMRGSRAFYGWKLARTAQRTLDPELKMTISRERTRAALLAITLSPALYGCSSISGPDQMMVLNVAEERVVCMGAAPQECYLVRQGSTGEMTLFYEEILGFDYTPGYRYELLVTRSTNEEPMQDASMYTYRLERELSRQQSPRADLLAETAAAEAKWRTADLSSYTMVQQRLCFCGSAGLGSVRLAVTREHLGATVRERTTAIERVEDGSVVPAEMAHEFLSVQQLFRDIRWAVADDVHRIDVEFDEDLGYPRRVSIDRRVNVSDDEVEYVIETLTPGT